MTASSIARAEEDLLFFCTKVRTAFPATYGQKTPSTSGHYATSVTMKAYSRRIWAPAIGGMQRRTHWFYERVRGEYLNEQAYLSSAEKGKFQLENPKTQLLDKSFLSKSENSWLQKPDTVSKGAQYSFVAFAEHITDWLERDDFAITESYFKDAVARVILFRRVEKLVSDAKWYQNGFRAQTVTYTIAYLSYMFSQRGAIFNFKYIWDEQNLSKDLLVLLEFISKLVYDVITNPPTGSANIAQWCKRPACWTSVKQIRIDDIALNPTLFIDKGEEKLIRRSDRQEKRLDVGIDIQSFVVTREITLWLSLFEYYQRLENRSGISNMQLDILKRMAHGQLLPPSEKQSKVLYQLYERAVSEGATAG